MLTNRFGEAVKAALQTFLIGEEPTTCPSCGARTEFEEIEDGLQLHQCLNEDCGKQFIGESDDAEETEDVCSDCGGVIDLAGYDGRCGNCADIIQNQNDHHQH